MDETSEGTVDFDHVHNDLELKAPSVREECSHCASADDGVSELCSSFDEVLQVEVEFPVGVNACCDVTISEKNRVLGDCDAASDVPSVRYLCKCATFPISGCVSATYVDDDEDSPQENIRCMRAMSLPVPRKVISAMKGSREKEGLSLRKLSVSWDPEVYDPPPSSVSHLPKRNNQSYRNNKKYGKGKQKGKNPQGSRKKDKKHHRRGGERAEPSFGVSFAMDPVSSYTGMIPSNNYNQIKDPALASDTGMNPSSSYKPTNELSDFDNGGDSPDSNCGSSFLRRSHGSVHYPYAEAT